MKTFHAEQADVAIERAVGEPIAAAPQRSAQPESSWRSATETPGQAHQREILKVSTRSRPSAVAGAIAGVMRERGEVEVQAIGAGAANQAIKAIAIARAYLVDDNIDVCMVPAFIDILIDGQERTALRMFVHRRPA